MTTERDRSGLGVNATSRLRVIGDGDDRACILETLPHVILAVRADGAITDANAAAENFFEMSKPHLIGAALDKILPFGSSLLTLIAEVRERGAAINEYKVDLGRFAAGERRVDAHCAPLRGDRGDVLVVLQERTIAEKIDRQLTHRGAARSVSALRSLYSMGFVPCRWPALISHLIACLSVVSSLSWVL